MFRAGEKNKRKDYPSFVHDENGILEEEEEPMDENMNRTTLGSRFSISSTSVIDQVRTPDKNLGNVTAKTDKVKLEEVRPTSLHIPQSAATTLNLAAVANEVQLRQCPILVKDISFETADDDDNENHLTISSLTARPLIAKSQELRTKRIARKVREAERRARIRRFKPPDGGYGWAIVVGAFLVQFWVSGLVKSYGVLFVEIMEEFSDNTSAAMAAWIPAILSTLCLALGKFELICINCKALLFFTRDRLLRRGLIKIRDFSFPLII